MTVGKLKQLLGQYDENLEVGLVVSYTEHDCGSEECYCVTEDHTYSISALNKEEVFDKKTKKQKLTKILIRGD